MTKMRGPDCVVMYNLINTHTNRQTYDIQVGRQTDRQTDTHTQTHTHTHTHNKEAGGGAQDAQGSSKICTSRESVSPLSRLIRGFRNKYH